MVYSASPDLTAAWYAAAPPPPPPPAPQKTRIPPKRASMAGASSSVVGYRGASALRTSSSSTSLTFDRRAQGDDLPVDAHSPEPERPVSRNAVARARERERQRSRTNSTASYNGAPAFHAEGQSQQAQQLYPAPTQPDRTPSPGPRTRRESSPAVAGAWSTYPPQEHYTAPHPHAHPHSPNAPAVPQYGQAYHPSASPVPVPSMYAQLPSQQQQHPSTTPGPLMWSAGIHAGYAPQHAVQTYGQPSHVVSPHHYVAQQQYGSQPAILSGYAPAAYAQPTYTAEPTTIQSPVYAASPTPWGQPAMAHSVPTNVPFPTSAMPPPPGPAHPTHPSAYAGPHPTYGTPTPSAQGRPLPSTASRSSSQSSSVGTRASVTSLGSATGTVRRSLPQPPQPRAESGPPLPQPGVASARTISSTDASSTLSRHDSVRMAAEQIMARGPPRRKPMPSSMRSNTHSNASRSDGSITDGTVPGTAHHRPQPATSAVPRNRAESASCLEREMRAMKLQQCESDTVSQPTVRTPLAPPTQPTAPQAHVAVPSSPSPMRASSPRPIRASPAPAPDVTMASSSSSSVEDAIPQRPVSRGPKDGKERRRSMEVSSVSASNGFPSIRSPPPDAKPPVPTISFGEAEQRGARAIPSIVFPGDDGANHGGPQICVTGDDDDDDDHHSNEAPQIYVSGGDEGERPTGTISISVSASGPAQRSTTSTSSAGTGWAEQPHVHAHAHLPRATPFAAPEPASAPSVGSGAGCATCKKWIGGRVVHALSHTFHPDCFVCYHCTEPLEHVAFYEHDGRPYCHFDFHELFSKRCFHCRTPIVDQRYITINDVELVGAQSQERCYHDLHFFCANCGDPFLDPKVAASAAGADVLSEIEDENGTVRYGGREFVVHKGYPYCEPCHVSLHKPRCKGCARSIVDEEYLTALRAKWHVGCFCCEHCRRPIDSDNFFVRDGKAYDEQCYKIKLRSEL